MILQRLATSIRKQDWFTVLIETLIVVFGVYLGIQLGNWNAARAEREAADRYLSQMSQTLEETVDHLDRVSSFYNELVSEGAVALDQLNGPELSDDDRENIYNVLVLVQQVRPIDPYGLGDFVGRLDRGEVLLGNPDLARAISEFGADLSNSDDILWHVTQRLNSYLLTMDKYSALGPVLPEDKQVELFLEEEAMADPTFRIALAGALNMASYRTENMTYIVQQCRELKDKIDGALE